jgi:predicted nucleotidyltransferase/DNA-binding MarR family transcriptional regulator
MLETLLGSKLRAKVLGWLFSHPDERYFVRQLTALVKEDSTNVSRELARLEKTGILVSTTEGRQKYYQANRKSAVFKELKGLMTQSAEAMITSTNKVSQYIEMLKPQLRAFCRRNNIQKLSLFGSVLREDFNPDSDIDVLVEFEPGKAPGLLKLAGMEEDLSALMGGRKIDLRTPQDLSQYFRDRVLKEAKVICQ